jgi:DNA-binding SARP family transcriptional activator
VLSSIPEITVTTRAEELLEVVRQRQATYVFDDENDELYREATVAFCDNNTAKKITTLLGEDDTYAIVLGEWEPHWLHIQEDGTPTAGSIADGPIADLGQCYVLDAETGRDLFSDLAEPDVAKEAPEPPEPEVELEPDSVPPRAQRPEPTEVTIAATTDEADTAATRFDLQLFGTHRLTWEGNQVHFRSSACLDLIAVMALSGWELTRDELTMVVAADAHLKQAKSRRSSTINRLREALANVTGRPKEHFLAYDDARAVYRLDTDLFNTDINDFNQRLANADTADDETQRAVELEAALERYTGPLGEALDEVWDLVELRAKYRDRAYQAALNLAALREASENFDDAAASLERATGIYPEEPMGWKHLIDLRNRQGNTEAAAEAERRHRRVQQLITAAKTR